MYTIEVSNKVGQWLNDFAHRTGRSERAYAEKALVHFLEDQEDYFRAVARLEKNKDKPRISWEEAQQRLGLTDADLED